MTATISSITPQYKFLLQSRGYSFFTKKSNRVLDTWEVFAMGIRDIFEITSGHPKIAFIYVPLPPIPEDNGNEDN